MDDVWSWKEFFQGLVKVIALAGVICIIGAVLSVAEITK